MNIANKSPNVGNRLSVLRELYNPDAVLILETVFFPDTVFFLNIVCFVEKPIQLDSDICEYPYVRAPCLFNYNLENIFESTH